MRNTSSGALHGTSFLTLLDFSGDEIDRLIETAGTVKKEMISGVVRRRFAGLSLAMVFEKRSTRTRCAFETAFGEESGYPVFLSNQDIQMGEKESVDDTARVLGRMFSAIQFRGYKQETAETLAKYSGVPVYNGLTDLYHPTQALADLLTMYERFGTCKGLRLCYVGDGRNNVARSLVVAAAKTGIDLVFASPEPLRPAPELIELVSRELNENGGSVSHTTDVVEAATGANVVYTDVWISMGEESRELERIELLEPYRVTESLMELADPGSIFLHCLPAVRGMEVAAEVLDGNRSAAWDQAENRKHTIKALMIETLL